MHVIIYTYIGAGSSSSSTSATGDTGRGVGAIIGMDPWAQQSVTAGSGSLKQ